MLEGWGQECIEKYIDPKDLEKRAAQIKEKGFLVTLNGSFDLLHAGHLKILMEAKQQGGQLLVLLNSDASIQQYKSPERPIIPLKYRLEMMAALFCVDYVSWFEELDPRHVLSLIKPHVHVNGSEYGKDCLEAETVLNGGGVIHVVDLVPGLSTSNIIEKIKGICV